MALFTEHFGPKELLLRTGFIAGGVFVLTSLVLLVAGAPPWPAFYHLFVGALGSWNKLAQVLMVWIPLTLCACGLLYSFRIGLWNIGVEGQVVAGAIASTAVLRFGVDGGAPALMIVLAFAAGMLGGSVWAILAGFLKTKGGVNEIFGGLGLNFVAQGITLWLIFGPWKRPGVGSMSGTELFPESLWLPTFLSGKLSPVGLAVAGLALVLATWVLSRTRLGLALKGIGSNARAAYLHGLSPNTYFIMAMGMAGGCAGLAGAFQVTGVYHRLIPIISSNYGYLALLVVMLANYRAWGSPWIAFFFACLNVGSIQLPIVLKLDSSLSGIIQGALVLTTLLVYGLRRNREKERPA
ncbi:MAG: ABC transporter permease [Desulfobacterota bacterium]|jgi:simple sugar transport system permease protein|nr:ABC transporter permease [Thermodesulfobacteriota bacterium]